MSKRWYSRHTLNLANFARAQVTSDRYFLKQKINWLEALTSTAGYGCCTQANGYGIFDAAGELAYTAVEESNCWCRCCCAPYHRFQLNVFEGKGESKQQVMTFFHPWVCGGCCICMDTCRGTMYAFEGRVDGAQRDKCFADVPEGGWNSLGNPIATARQPICGGYLTPTFEVQEGKFNEEAEPAYSVKGPTCCIGGIIGECCCPATFNVFSGRPKDDDAKVLAEIKKDKPEGVGGMLKQTFTDADNFTINMPADSKKGAKTAILASSIMIDYLFYEDGGNCYLDHGTNEEPPAIVLRCTNFYVCGALVPCNLRIPLGSKDK